MNGFAPSEAERALPEARGRCEPDPHLDALEAQITELAAHIHAATYRLLVLLAEFDRRLGWGHWGVRSCAHWLNWKCGIGLNAAREKVRVARSLEGLPLIAESFRKGQVSYSKVRAMTRVATPENEDYLLEIARHGTASHVERLVRHVGTVRRGLEARRANETQAARYLRFHEAEDGSMVLEARLPPEAGQLMKQALGAAAEALYVAGKDQDVSAVTSLSRSAYLPPDPWEALHGDKSPCDRPCGESEPIEARRADALTLMAETLLRHGPGTRSGGERHALVVHVDAPVLDETTEDGRASLEDGTPLPLESIRRLGCDAGFIRLLEDSEGMPLDVGRKTRTIPPAIHRALKLRDGGCRFPGCTARLFVEGHHIRHWADGGETSLANLVSLCRYHHRLVHEEGYAVEKTGRNAFAFTRPDGTAIHRVPEDLSENVTAETSDNDLEALNGESGLAIDSHTCESLWDGTVIDWGMAVDGVMARDGLLNLDIPP
jgi:hypothetical protein